MSASIIMLPSKAFEEALLNAPAMAAPPGMHHNFVDPPNLQTIIHIVMIVCLSLSMLAVGMRMWTKTRVVRRVALEDCNPSLLFSSAHSSADFFSVLLFSSSMIQLFQVASTLKLICTGYICSTLCSAL